VKRRSTVRIGRPEKGIALLIAIFILLLISVVAIALIVSSGTESALAGNYRSATGVYYAALAGLEEARGRLLAKNPSSFRKTDPGFLPPPPLAVGSPVYIINPVGGESVAPWDPSSAYPDTEYETEFGANPPNPSPRANSVSSAGGVQGPLYKWVRINAVSEQSLNLDVDGDGLDPSAIYYDGTRLTVTPTGTQQVLEITSFAVLPNGSRKLVQYLVVPNPINIPPFHAALTLVGSTGNNVNFIGPGTPDFIVSGKNDLSHDGCPPGPTPFPAIGYVNGDSSQISAAPAGNYQGPGGTSTTPSVSPVTLPPAFQTPAGLEGLVQTITQNADKVITPSTGTAYPSSFPSAMSSSNPMTIVVNGDLDLTGWHNTGYGLLLVTGTLRYDPDASWDGIVLVIGKGVFVSTKIGRGQFNGAMLIANTRDGLGNLLSTFGAASYSQTGDVSQSNGYGIYYSSCWINLAMPALGYKILSFHEIPSQ
jgi:hypothetical protein